MFTIRTLLHMCHNHKLTSYIFFVDLVKAFDMDNHKMMLKILVRYVSPWKLCSAIEQMFVDLKLVLKIGKVEESMSQTAQVLFMFMVMAFAEKFEKEWVKADLKIITLKKRQTRLMTMDNWLGTNRKPLQKAPCYNFFVSLCGKWRFHP